MINKRVLEFLKNLKTNNNRNWFQENKKLYLGAKEEFELFANFLIHELQQVDVELVSLSVKDCVFRIYRDVRFSKDKSPYKTHFGAYFVKGGKKSGYAGYYIQVAPGNSFIAGGVYHPPSDTLRRIRTEIYSNVEEYKTIINDDKFLSHFHSVEGDKLISSPAGFPREFPDIDLLKNKSYTVFRPVSDMELLNKNFIASAVVVFNSMKPFITFLNNAINPDY